MWPYRRNLQLYSANDKLNLNLIMIEKWPHGTSITKQSLNKQTQQLRLALFAYKNISWIAPSDPHTRTHTRTHKHTHTRTHARANAYTNHFSLSLTHTHIRTPTYTHAYTITVTWREPVQFWLDFFIKLPLASITHHKRWLSGCFTLSSWEFEIMSWRYRDQKKEIQMPFSHSVGCAVWCWLFSRYNHFL